MNNHPALSTAFSLLGLAALSLLLMPGNVLTTAFHAGLPIDDVAGRSSWQGMLGTLRNHYHDLIPFQLRRLVWQLYTNPLLYTVVPFLLLLEMLFPCDPKQKLVSRGFAQDAVWFVTSLPFNVIILGTTYELLGKIYTNYLGFLTIESAAAWPVGLQVTVVFLVRDFIGWLHHFVRHKLHPLWLFHAVHHSQRELNLFTDDRVHIVDGLVIAVIGFVPLLMFKVSSTHAAILTGVIIPIYTRFLHTNVRIDLGVLGRVLASPQFHRIHHSREAEHRDRNFGVVLSVWDHLFGTAHPSNTVYPNTGVDDNAFPQEQAFPSGSLLINWVRQILYPFGQLFRTVIPGKSVRNG